MLSGSQMQHMRQLMAVASARNSSIGALTFGAELKAHINGTTRVGAFMVFMFVDIIMANDIIAALSRKSDCGAWSLCPLKGFLHMLTLKVPGTSALT